MKLLSEPLVSEEAACPYLKDRKWRFSYFFATEVDGEELNYILSRGWRKFGMYYFKPVCRGCRECVPIRLNCDKLQAAKSQKRVLRKCEDIRVEFRDLEYRDEIYELYRVHSLDRFGKESNVEDFQSSFYTPSCPAIQSEYYIGDRLAGVGFLDVSTEALSSVYFIYHTDFLKYSLGTFSILRESAFAVSMGFRYYYLGYYIRENRSMAYKNSFHMNEKMDWLTGRWLDEIEFESCEKKILSYPDN
ncbi:MAG TPA: hypothetical protein PK358_09975 [Spirochaetota bacterium]|nr:hypothetical protein [Spirochaetota bacterium]HPJ35151.1 hypothetical protein [Spirochaetota bacterium]